MSMMSRYAAVAANLFHHGFPHLAQRVEDLLESDTPSALAELAELVMLDGVLETALERSPAGFGATRNDCCTGSNHHREKY